MYKKLIGIIYTLSILGIGFGGASLLAIKLDIGNETLTANVHLVDQKKLIIDDKFNLKEVTKEKKQKDTVDHNCPQPKEEYLDMFLLNIGQEIGLIDSNYIPNNLIELPLQQSLRKGICLTKETYEAFRLMQKSAEKDGYIIKVVSGFRSYNYQKILFDRKNVENSDNVAKPGYSEHQLGTTIDLGGSSTKYTSLSNSFGETMEGKWLEENAHRFGFIMSYPKDTTKITGYIYEPWHYRYFGVRLANKIKNSGLTPTEFLK